MESYSLISEILDKTEADIQRKMALLPASPWAKEERTKKKRDGRVKRAYDSFDYFRETYFPEELFSGGYFPPNRMARDIVVMPQTPGVHVVAGPRDETKTATTKMLVVWMFLTEQLRFGGTYSHTMPTSSNILGDIADLIRHNARIVEDWEVEFIECNDEQFAFRTGRFSHTCYMQAFSEGVSVRGATRLLSRPELILGDDIETLMSPLGGEHTRTRLKRISEALQSLTPDGVFLWLCNIFDVRCATYQIAREAEKDALPENWHFHKYQGWDAERGEPMWVERFGRISEEEYKRAKRCRSEGDYQGNIQQTPQEDDGDIFPRLHLTHYTRTAYENLDDLVGVIYADQNLSKKGLGDTTAIQLWYYSPSADALYLGGYFCQSYSDPNKLLNDVISLRTDRVFLIGFDGWVSQEATWEQHIRNWCIRTRKPFPRVEFYRINVDAAVTTPMAMWIDGRIRFPEDIEEQEQGRRMIQQIVTFAGKKAGRLDDAPDCMICSIEMLLRMHVLRPEEDDSSDERVGTVAEITLSHSF